MENLTKKLIWLSIFAAAMANVEAAVVVYLRLIYYPEGFNFPIVPTPMTTTLIELSREAATIVMLYAVARLSYRKALYRFCAFIFLFGVWDIFYYVWLYVFLKWPPSLFTWDILYLIPLPWIGPVIAPVLISLSFITAAFLTLHLEERGIKFHNPSSLWIIMILAGLIIILSFIYDYQIVIQELMPTTFKWGIFILGMLLGIGVFIWAYKVSLKQRNKLVK